METNALLFASNMFGSLKPHITKRINKFLNNPTTAGWEDIHSIIIDGSGQMRTIWQAVIRIKPSFPRSGRTEDEKGRVIKDWREIPTPQEVIKAIQSVVVKPAQLN